MRVIHHVPTVVVKPHPLGFVRLPWVLQVTVGEQGVETGGGGLKTVEIWVESPSMAAVGGLHHAVLGRVQVNAHTCVE